METKIINISIPEQLLKDADQVAKEEYRSRSEIFREALRAYIRDRNELEGIFQDGEKKAKESGLEQKDIERAIQAYRRRNRK